MINVKELYKHVSRFDINLSIYENIANAKEFVFDISKGEAKDYLFLIGNDVGKWSCYKGIASKTYFILNKDFVFVHVMSLTYTELHGKYCYFDNIEDILEKLNICQN